MENNILKKILFCGFHYHVNSKFIKRFVQEFNIGSYLTITVNPQSKINYDYNFYKFGDSLKYIDWNSKPEIDLNLLASISQEKYIAIEMLSRINPKMNFRDRESYFLKQLRFWDYTIKEQNITLFISDNIPHDGFDYIIFIICKYHKIKTIMFHELPTRPKRHLSMHVTENINEIGADIFNKYLDLRNNKNISEKNLSPRMQNYFFDMQKPSQELIQFTQKKTEKNFIEEISFFLNNNIENLLSNILKKIKNDKYYNKYNFVTFLKIAISLLKKLLPSLIRFLVLVLNKSKIYLSEYDFYLTLCNKDLNLNTKYIYFALHYQPELSTSPLAGEYVNQLLIIDILSKSLPNNYYLYVKEHPRISYNRNRNFYKKIKSYQNIILCKPELNTYDLIDNSIAVATATGSVGWEAFLRKKPVLMFGYRFYQYAPNVFRIFNKNDCNRALNEIIKPSYKICSESIIKYLFALDYFTFEGYNTRSKEKLCNLTNEENVSNYINILKHNNLSDYKK